MLFQNVKIRENLKKNKLLVYKSAARQALCCFFAAAFSIFLNNCRAPKVEMRRLAPADAIVYLETNDLGKTLQSLTESSAFRERAAEKPDFSALETVQLAIAVTGFEASENQLTSENSILNFTTRFVAVAETRLWQWQAVSLVENQLNSFVRGNYGADAGLEKSDQWDGKFFAWSANDGRKVYALAKNSRVYFGNDQAAIEKCLTAQIHEDENSAGDKIYERAATSAKSENNLAFGYVSAAGVKQIADLAGISVAVEASEEAAAKSFIARIAPQLLQNAVEEIVWTANRTERGIEDDYKIRLKPEVAAVTKETLSKAAASDSIDFLPPEFFSATRYNLKNPLIAWRSLLVLTAKNTDASSGSLLMRFSDALLEPYGVARAEEFLSSIDSEIATIQFDETGERSAAIVTVKDSESLKSSIAGEINFQSAPIAEFNAAVWFSEDKQTAAAFVENKFIIGDAESVTKCLTAKQSGRNFTKTRNAQRLSESRAATAVTFAQDTDSANKVVRILAAKKNEDRQLATFYSTETRFTGEGVERKTVSDFGLIGTILKQLND